MYAKLKKILTNAFDYMKLLHEFNTLELKYDTLLNATKDDLFKKKMDKLGEPKTIARLKEDNKKLRLKIKELKEVK